MKQELSQAFQEILEGLERGQSLEELLASYPDSADALRALLHTASRIPAARVQQDEIHAMRSRLDSHFEGQLAALNFPKKRSKRPLLILVASIALAFWGIWIFLPRGETEGVTEIRLTQSTEISSETPTLATPSPSLSPTSVQPSPSPRASRTLLPPTALPSLSPTKTSIPATASPSPNINPTKAGACLPRSDWPEYRLQSGDTLSQIAINSGTSLESLMLANCLNNPRDLIVGQTIVVPRLWTNTDSNEQDDETDDDNSNGDSEDDNSGSGSDDDADDDNSGSGSDDDDSEEDNSGSDSEDDNSGSGSNDD